MTTVSAHSLGQYVQLAGAAAFIVGGILSLHHYAIGICFIAGGGGVLRRREDEGGVGISDVSARNDSIIATHAMTPLLT